MAAIYDFSVTSINGEEQPMTDFRGKLLLIVNTASKCGFTPQYEGLQKLYERYCDRGLEILGFPCNQFMGQEPGTMEEIQRFCTSQYSVTFPMFDKIEVKGPDAHPLYQFLTRSAPGILGSKAVKWNFTKFLVDANGKVIKRFAPATSPEKIATAVEAALPA